MEVQLLKFISGTQIPTLSIVNCTSHQRIVSGELTETANWKAYALESGKSPEKPPLAMIAGALPATWETVY